MAADPYRYFRIEAAELLGSALEHAARLGAPGGRAVAALLRTTHTLKGAAGVVRHAALVRLAHDLEELLLPFRGGEEVPADVAARVLELLDLAAREVEALPAAGAQPPGQAGGAPAPPGRDAPPRGPEAGELPGPELGAVRVELGELDELLAELSEAAGEAQALREALESLTDAGRGGPRAELREARERLRRLERELSQARARAQRARLVPLGVLFEELARSARETARAAGKEVRFEAHGGEGRVEPGVLARLRPALLHAVRNAVAHGLEPPAERRARGKPAAGTVTVEVERFGERVRVSCRDDGRGVDARAVGQAALAAGLLEPSAAAALDLEGAIALLLRGGLSTAGRVSHEAGRGLGLEAARAAVAELGGELDADSAPGASFELRFEVPTSRVAVRTLLVEAGGRSVSLPLSAVREVTGARDGATAAALHADRALPVADLALLLEGEPSRVEAPAGALVVLAAAGELAALRVGRIGAIRDEVVRPLPTLGRAPLVAGASLDAAGVPHLVLDPARLVEAARAGRGAPKVSPAAPRRAVLVIDDSLTTRMLEKSLLEARGYAVDVAESAEEGLELARAGDYALFLVDLELPGMSGIDFVTLTRADPALQGTPAVLLTTRGGAEDRRRGLEAGAAAYLVKGEFEEGELMRTVRGLIG